MNLRNTALLGLVCFLVGAAATRYLVPPVTKTEIVEHEVVRNDIRTVTRVVERPDGTRETVTDSTDRSQLNSSRSETVQVLAKPQWFIAGTAQIQPQNGQIYYSAEVNRRILGPFYAGLRADTSGRLGLSVGFEF